MIKQRVKVLFFAESATLAHIARAYLLAKNLSLDKFEVHFASSTYFDFVFKDAPFRLHSIKSRSPKDFQKVLENKGVLFDDDIIRTYVKEELALIKEIAPDIVVGDLRPSLGVSAPIAGVPYISLTNAYWSPYTKADGLPAMYSTLAKSRKWLQPWARMTIRHEEREFLKILPIVTAIQAAGLDKVREEYGLSPFPNYLTGFTWGDMTLYSDTPDLVALESPPANHRYIGPVSWSPKVDLPSWWTTLPQNKKIVYLSLGSSGPVELLPTLIKALSSMDVSVVMSSAGAELPKDTPDNIFVAPYLPGELVLERADIAITNGGSPSTYQAFQAGVPVLGLPANMDQLLCMKHAVMTGACLSVRSDIATLSTLRTSIENLLNNKIIHDKAKSLEDKLKSYSSNELFSSALLDLVEDRFAVASNF